MGNDELIHCTLFNSHFKSVVWESIKSLQVKITYFDNQSQRFLIKSSLKSANLLLKSISSRSHATGVDTSDIHMAKCYLSIKKAAQSGQWHILKS